MNPEMILQANESTPKLIRPAKRAGRPATAASVRTVVACSVANVNLAGTIPSSLDGITLPDDCEVMLRKQTTASQNGIYNYSTTGPTLTKVADFVVDDPIAVIVSRGTVFAGHIFAVNANNSIQLVAAASTLRIKASSGTDVATGIDSAAKVTDGSIAAQLDTVLRTIIVSSVDKVAIRTDALWTDGTNTKALSVRYNSTRTLWFANGSFFYG